MRIRISTSFFVMIFYLGQLFGCNPEDPVLRQERQVTSAGASLFVESFGEGEPIIVVHGGPGLDHSYFLPYLEPLARDFRVIFYDQRASGRSTAGDTSAFTMEQFVADIDAVRKAYDYETVHLMAHSWGGLLAMRYAIEQPERLRSLILVNTNPASSSLQEAANARLQDRITPADSAARMEVISSNAFRDREPEALVAYFRVAFRPSFYDPALVSKLSFFFDDHYVTNSGMLQRLGADASFQAFDLHPFLEEVPVPVLILHGVHDPVSLDEITPMHEAFPDSRLVLMEESGHFPFVEKPDAFNAHVRQFLIEISE